MTIVIARTKHVKEIVARSPHPKKFLNPGNCTRKRPMRSLTIRNLIGNPLAVKIKHPNPKKAV